MIKTHPIFFNGEMIIKKCKSFEGYSVSEYGNVYSHRTRKPLPDKKGSYAIIDHSRSKELKPTKNKKGYSYVSIQTPNGIRSIGIHVLVADAFIRSKNRGEQIRHLDGNNQINHYSNLAWGSAQDNADDRKRHGRYASGSKHPNSKLTVNQVGEIISLRQKKIKVKSLAKSYDVSVSTIESIIYRKAYKNEISQICNIDEYLKNHDDSL